MSDLEAVLANIESNLDACLRTTVCAFAYSFNFDRSRPTPRNVAHAPIGTSRIFAASASRPMPARRRVIPIVVAHDRNSSGRSVLFYGHYDVQPVDPVELWDHDPFEPFIETRPDGSRAIRARGASDDKGQVMTFIEACRAWKAVTGKLPVPTSILLEGEEESGGASLPPFLETHADELRADIGLICDTNMWDRQTPAIQTMLRGLCGEELTIRAADRDLHSRLLRVGSGESESHPRAHSFRSA